MSVVNLQKQGVHSQIIRASFIDASIERNKQLNNREYAQIELYIKTQKSRSISSEYGFWYAYNTQIETDTQTPEFGDLVHYDIALKTLEGQVIYPDKKLETQPIISINKNYFQV